jgi:hypothetical protein
MSIWPRPPMLNMPMRNGERHTETGCDQRCRERE